MLPHDKKSHGPGIKIEILQNETDHFRTDLGVRKPLVQKTFRSKRVTLTVTGVGGRVSFGSRQVVRPVKYN